MAKVRGVLDLIISISSIVFLIALIVLSLTMAIFGGSFHLETEGILRR